MVVPLLLNPDHFNHPTGIHEGLQWKESGHPFHVRYISRML